MSFPVALSLCVVFVFVLFISFVFKSKLTVLLFCFLCLIVDGHVNGQKPRLAHKLYCLKLVELQFEISQASYTNGVRVVISLSSLHYAKINGKDGEKHGHVQRPGEITGRCVFGLP